MFKLLKHCNLYKPKSVGSKDILISNQKIIAIEDDLSHFDPQSEVIDCSDKIVTPGFIDQHIHIAGAGGTNGFYSRTPEVTLSELISCGTTTAVGLIGTDGKTRDVRNLYAKAKALDQEGISAYMYCGYYGIDTITITDNIQSDMIFIDKILGCKIAISDIRCSYPTAQELLRKVSDVRIGGNITGKKGILHIHVGYLDSKLDVLFELVEKYKFPIKHISPTHVGRTKALFEQAIEFAKLGGIVDITTGASRYTDPYKAVLYALENGVSIDNITFSTDAHAGLSKKDENGNIIGSKIAPADQNLYEVVQLIKKGGVDIEDAFKLITTNPATNLGLHHKGKIELGYDADICVFDKNLKLTDVFAKGQHMMKEQHIIVKGTYELSS